MIIFTLFSLIVAASAKNEIFDGYSLYQITVKDVDQAKLVTDIEAQFNADVWTYAVPGRAGQAMLPKEQKVLFEKALKNAGVEYEIETENVKELLDKEDELLIQTANKSANRTENGALALDRIYEYEEIDAYLEEVAAKYPSILKLVLAGHSFEGRPIKYLKISSTDFQDTSKPVVFIESLIHAREWITLPVTLYAIQKLVIDGLNVLDQDLLQNIDWIILPIVNPDGYDFTHNGNRLWRKSRATGYMINDICTGVDLNRNFDVNWSIYSSNLVCSEVFHGRAPFSEPETALVRDIIAEHEERLELFLDIHSFGSMILYGYGSGTLPPNGQILHLAGVQMAQTIDSVKMDFNANYVVGNVASVLYEASGSAQDYAQFAGVNLAYTFELPGYRYNLGTGLGFLVDPDFIEQAGFETWEGIKAGARLARNYYRLRKGF